MTKPWFDSAEKIQRLERAAAAWLGTPFFPNAAVLQAGVSCQKLVARLYVEAGFLPDPFEVPDGPMDWGLAHGEDQSLIAKFLDGMPDRFAAVQPPARPGDLVGFKIGGCVQHLGIVLPENRFVHCLERVAIRRLDDATYARRLVRIWRPIASEHECHECHECHE